MPIPLWIRFPVQRRVRCESCFLGCHPFVFRGRGQLRPARSERVRFYPAQQLPAGTVAVQETDGSAGTGPLNCVFVTLAPLEVQILGC